MITFTKAYVANGKTFATLEQAQAAEIGAIFQATPGADPTVVVMENADKIVDVLTTKGDSRPKARALNGGRKPRKPAANGTPEAAKTLDA
jgi:hypothetical protein